jgi:hypothetical protein
VWASVSTRSQKLFFVLRQVDQAQLLGSAAAGALSRTRPAAGKRIAADRLSAVFGIELEEEAPARSSRRAPRRKGERTVTALPLASLGLTDTERDTMHGVDLKWTFLGTRTGARRYLG